MRLADPALPLARRALEDAVHKLAGRQSVDLDRDATGAEYDPAKMGDRAWGPSRWNQLCTSLDTPRATSRAPRGGSQPPVWVDCLDLRNAIETTVRTAATAHLADPPAAVEAMLHALADHQWRPQDTTTITSLAVDIDRYADAIDDLFDPPKRLSLAAACTVCGESTVHREDRAGEIVRQPALQLGEHGCECLNCGQLWAPEAFADLARSLGTLPPGVLE